jgi:hypothetical protein
MACKATLRTCKERMLRGLHSHAEGSRPENTPHISIHVTDMRSVFMHCRDVGNQGVEACDDKIAAAHEYVRWDPYK